jgi:pimeloyl-ACP methyl ester carboxylesterase
MGKRIVMIHGMWCGSWVWNNYQPFFKDKGYACHTPVLRYHDISPNDTPDPALGTTSLLDYVQDLQEYISSLDEEPVIIGHSMGGLIAQMLGARGRAKALVLLTSAPPSGLFFFGCLSKRGRLTYATLNFPVRTSNFGPIRKEAV